jgi:hypothetical protein
VRGTEGRTEHRACAAVGVLTGLADYMVPGAQGVLTLKPKFWKLVGDAETVSVTGWLAGCRMAAGQFMSSAITVTVLWFTTPMELIGVKVRENMLCFYNIINVSCLAF